MKKNIKICAMYSGFISIVIILFGTGILGTASICVVQGTWTQKADIPTPRWFLSSCAVNGKIYTIGGVDGYANVEEYNPVSDTWSTKAPMPTSRGFLATSAVNGKIYAIGGERYFFSAALAAMEEYDPVTDNWTTKAGIPSPTTGHAVAVVAGKIYVIGGGPSQSGSSGQPPYHTVREYDPGLDTWKIETDMPTARNALCGVAVDDKIYAIRRNCKFRIPVYRAPHTRSVRSDRR